MNSLYYASLIMMVTCDFLCNDINITAHHIVELYQLSVLDGKYQIPLVLLYQHYIANYVGIMLCCVITVAVLNFISCVTM